MQCINTVTLKLSIKHRPMGKKTYAYSYPINHLSIINITRIESPEDLQHQLTGTQVGIRGTRAAEINVTVIMTNDMKCLGKGPEVLKSIRSNKNRQIGKKTKIFFFFMLYSSVKKQVPLLSDQSYQIGKLCSDLIWFVRKRVVTYSEITLQHLDVEEAKNVIV